MVSDYSLREKTNIYGGMFLGYLAPVATMRYLVFDPKSESVPEEAAKWTLSALSMTPFSIILSVLGGDFGGNFGTAAANRLRDRRRSLEAKFVSE